MVISLSDFNKLAEKDKQKTLQDLKQQVGVSGIVKAWDISRSKAYSMLREFNISINTKAIRPSNSKKADQNTDTSAGQTDEKKDKSKPKLGKVPPNSALTVETTDDSKFYLSLETQGTAPLINDTIQALLASGKLSNANFHLNITIQEI